MQMIQTMQSALHHYINCLEDPSQWLRTIPQLQFESNNVRTAPTGTSPNEVVLGFTPNYVPDIVADRRPEQVFDRVAHRLSIHDAITLAAMTTNQWYND